LFKKQPYYLPGCDSYAHARKKMGGGHRFTPLQVDRQMARLTGARQNREQHSKRLLR
jgi:hypothetical protein